MTESPRRLPESSPSATPPQRGERFGVVKGLVRLVFLSLAGLIGIGAGAALAVFFPDRNPQPPFLETALQNLRLTGETRVTPNINNSPEVLPASPILPSASSPTESPLSSANSSPNAEASQLQRDLQQAQQQLKEVNDRTASLEQKLGVPSPNDSLENRLERLSQLSQKLATASPPNTSTTTPQATPSNTSSPNTTPSTTPSTLVVPSPTSPNSPSPIIYGGINQKKITLPSDPLFDGNSSTLRPEAIILLSQVANELRGIPGTAVQVTVHTNLSGEPDNDRRLSFQQAKTIREYLATQLGDRFRFVAIGYGSSRPLVTAIDRPENRRIEMIVE